MSNLINFLALSVFIHLIILVFSVLIYMEVTNNNTLLNDLRRKMKENEGEPK